MSATASGSCTGRDGQFAGIVCVASGGIAPGGPEEPGPPLDAAPLSGLATVVVAAGGAGSVCTWPTWIIWSGTISATDELSRSWDTSPADMVAAIASGAASWVTPVPPADLIELTR